MPKAGFFGGLLGAGVGSGGGGGGGFPSLALTSPTFVTGKNGQALSGGSTPAALAIGSFTSTDTDKGDIQMEVWMKATAAYTGTLYGNNKLITLKTPTSSDTNIGLYLNGTSGLNWGWANRPDYDQIGITGSSNYANGSYHHFMAVLHNQYGNTYYSMFWDGQPAGDSGQNQQFFPGTAVPITIDFSKASVGFLIDSIKISSYPASGGGKNAYSDSGAAFTPQALFTRDTYATVIWQLDGNGNGS